MEILETILIGLPDAVFIKNEILPHSHQIQFLNIIADFMTQVIVTVAGAAEGVFLTFNLDHRNFAAPVAFLFTTCADEGLFVDHFPVGKDL